MKTPRSAWVWVVAWPVLILLYAVWIILAPVVWICKGVVRAVTWD